MPSLNIFVDMGGLTFYDDLINYFINFLRNIAAVMACCKADVCYVRLRSCLDMWCCRHKARRVFGCVCVWTWIASSSIGSLLTWQTWAMRRMSLSSQVISVYDASTHCFVYKLVSSPPLELRENFSGTSQYISAPRTGSFDRIKLIKLCLEPDHYNSLVFPKEVLPP